MDEGNVTCWGRNDDGRLGRPSAGLIPGRFNLGNHPTSPPSFPSIFKYHLQAPCLSHRNSLLAHSMLFLHELSLLVPSPYLPYSPSPLTFDATPHPPPVLLGPGRGDGPAGRGPPAPRRRRAGRPFL